MWVNRWCHWCWWREDSTRRNGGGGQMNLLMRIRSTCISRKTFAHLRTHVFWHGWASHSTACEMQNWNANEVGRLNYIYSFRKKYLLFTKWEMIGNYLWKMKTVWEMIDESDDGMFRDEVRREMICSKFTRSPTRAIFSIHLLSVELASILSTDSTYLFKYHKHNFHYCTSEIIVLLFIQIVIHKSSK